uniref:Uncharacterized protein n=1 Tax=Histiona aroides TaxID=392300 RepID=M4QD19_HISAR|nr:hypothetical protein L075_p018 [Histiona aroides]AGH24085.1 hypothetical protein [Histiona aroides]
MIRQQQSILKTILAMLCTNNTAYQAKMLFAEYHLMPNETLTAHIKKITKERQYYRTTKLLRNINLFIICRSLFGCMGVYNIYNRKKHLKDNKEVLTAVKSIASYLYCVEMLNIAIVSIVGACLLRTMHQNDCTIKNIYSKTIDITKPLNLTDMCSVQLPILTIYSVLLNKSIYLILPDTASMHKIVNHQETNYGARSYLQDKKGQCQLSYGDIGKLLGFIHKPLVYLQYEKEYIKSTMYIERLKASDLDVVYYLGDAKLKGDRNKWLIDLVQDVDMYSQNNVGLSIMKGVKVTDYLYNLLNNKSSNIMYNSTQYYTYKKLALEGAPDSIENRRILHMQENIYNQYIKEYLCSDKEESLMPRVSKKLLNDLTQYRKNYDNNISLYEALLTTFTPIVPYTADAHIKNNKDALNATGKKWPSKDKNEYFYYFDTAAKKYACLIQQINAYKEKCRIVLCVSTPKTYEDICRLLNANKIEYTYDKESAITHNYIILSSTDDAYSAPFANSVYMMTEYTPITDRHVNKMRHQSIVLYYISREDILLKSSHINVNINVQYEDTDRYYEVISKTANTSSIRMFKYLHIYKEYVICSIYLQSIMSDLTRLSENHFNQLMKFITTNLILFNGVSFFNNIKGSKANNVFVGLDRCTIPIIHMEKKAQEQVKMLTKKHLLAEYINRVEANTTDKTDLSSTMTRENIITNVNNSIHRYLNIMAYEKKNYYVIKQDKHIYRGAHATQQALLQSILFRAISSMYYTYK